MQLRPLFADRLDWPFEVLHKDRAVPTATVSVDFKAPSRHGDCLDFKLAITKIGGSSMTLEMTVRCCTEVRLEVSQVLVLVNDRGRPIRWPDPVREKVTEAMEGAA